MYSLSVSILSLRALSYPNPEIYKRKDDHNKVVT